MNWGKWILVSFLLFTGFIATLVTICVRQDVSLVSPDYYAQEIAYQQQIDRVQHANALPHKPGISIVDRKLRLDFPYSNELDSGTLVLFYPARPDADQHIKLARSAYPVQEFTLPALQHGRCRAQLRWSMHGEEYYVEQVIDVQ